MSLSDVLEGLGRLPTSPAPDLRYLKAAADRVRDRWPEVQPTATEREREALACSLRDRVEKDHWGGARISFMVAASSAVFDEERRERADLARTRDFLYAETAASTSETFLSGVLRAYLESFTPQGAHSAALAAALRTATPRMSAATRALLREVPELLDVTAGPHRLARRMSNMSDPFTELVRLGLRNPHADGFMGSAHLALTSLVRPSLSDRSRIDWYMNWLRPPGKEEGRTVGAEAAIEALVHPWLNRTPDDELRSHLVETLIEMYGDPRIKSGGPWGGIGEAYMAIVHRWLTREDMRFFTGVVDASQNSAMWPPRRDFWLKLYDEGRIDAAWAALSSRAFEYAREHLMRQDTRNAHTRVGYQRARQNTSLLIMKIGNKIMVDGCHNYRTHVFDVRDPMAPKLFEEGYDCDEIMRASDRRTLRVSKSHYPIASWSRWVRDMINADVPHSNQTGGYSKVRRPGPSTRSALTTRPARTFVADPPKPRHGANLSAVRAAEPPAPPLAGGTSVDLTSPGAITPSPRRPVTGPERQRVAPEAPSLERFPPLPKGGDERLAALRGHVDELEKIGSWRRTFEERRTLSGAIRKLRNREQLIPNEIIALQILYEQLRTREKDPKG